MKRNLLLFTLVLFFSNTFSQGITDSLVSVQKLWSIVDNYQTLIGGKPVCYYIKISSDTIVNTINYNKVLRTYDKNKQHWTKIGFIREDSSGVYFMSNKMEEGLIYNFNVTINDTVKIFNPTLYHPIDAIVKSVADTIINFKTRRKITLINEWASEVWIEGIGSLNGIIQSGWLLSGITGANPRLLCYFDNETLEFSNPKYDFCFCSSTTNVKTGSKNVLFDIFPNPFINELFVRMNINSDLSSCKIKLYNIEGKEMPIQQITRTDTYYQLNIGNIVQGNYILSITDGEKCYYENVIKQ